MEPLTTEEFFAAGANQISAAWTLGHLACVSDLFSSWLSDRELRLPRETHKIFNSLDIGKAETTKAESVDPNRYSKSDIILLFRGAQVRTLRVLDEFDISTWDDPAPDWIPDTLPTRGAVWEHLAVHVYWHLGELAGSMERFYGTYSLNMVLHYFFEPREKPVRVEAVSRTDERVDALSRTDELLHG